jgi:hypothetical protein
MLWMLANLIIKPDRASNTRGIGADVGRLTIEPGISYPGPAGACRMARMKIGTLCHSRSNWDSVL